MKKYAGIGSRETPQEVLKYMAELGKSLALSGWTLRSGFADGADNAFAAGAEQVDGAMEIFIPWVGFNGAPKNDSRFFVPDFTDVQMEMAAKFHPAWSKCSGGAKKLHARNLNQVLGWNGDDSSDMIICWTPNGSGSGGTGQAIRVANHFNIPIFDLAIKDTKQKLINFLSQKD